MVKRYNYTNFEKMRFSNDCTVASVAMALRIPYSRVLKVAKSIGFKPNGKYGCDVYRVVKKLGYDCKIRAYFGDHRIGSRWVEHFARRRIPVKGIWIVSINSLNNRGGYHAVVVCNGVVYDPSNKRRANIDYVMRKRRHMYYGFTRDE